jgi:putative acetyltransferase
LGGGTGWQVVGGGGVAPLKCSEPDICELQKMYFLPAARGQGLAKKLALLARTRPYAGLPRCYLETTAFLKEAIGLYEHLGFAISAGRWAVPGMWIAK